MEKYYTPTIDEFYIGYEYEYLSTSYSPIIVDHTDDTIEFSKEKYEVWGKKVLDLPLTYSPIGSLYHISVRLGDKQIRTKYLDEQDILDLGFKFMDLHLPNRFFEYENEYIWIQLKIVDIFNHIISIRNLNNQSDFTGICKSKNELKTILKFLNVN